MPWIIEFFAKVPVWTLISLTAISVILGDLMGKLWSENPRPSLYTVALICYFLSGVFYL